MFPRRHLVTRDRNEWKDAQVSPNGKRIACVRRSNSNDEPFALYLWKTPGQREEKLVLTGHTDWILCMAWSPDSERIATGSIDGSVRVWIVGDVVHCDSELVMNHPEPVERVLWSPSGQAIASVDERGVTSIWNATTGNRINRIFQTGPSYLIDNIAYHWSPNELYFIAGCNDEHDIEVRNPKNRNIIHLLSGHTREVLTVAWSNDGRHVASGGEDWTVRVWTASPSIDGVVDSATVLRGHTGDVYEVAWSATDAIIASRSADGFVRTWCAVDGRPISVLEIFRNNGVTHNTIVSMAWAPKGEDIVTCGDCGVVAVWNAATGTKRSASSAFGQFGCVNRVRWSRDGKWIVSKGSRGVMLHFMSPWSVSIHKKLFSQKFRKVVFHLMLVRQRIDHKKVLLPSLPLEVWQLVFGFLSLCA